MPITALKLEGADPVAGAPKRPRGGHADHGIETRQTRAPWFTTSSVPEGAMPITALKRIEGYLRAPAEDSARHGPCRSRH